MITTILDAIRRLQTYDDRIGRLTLKACPFCGRTALLYSHVRVWLVECANFDACGAHGPIRDTPEDAAAAWNARVG